MNNPVIFDKDINPDDINQGQLGDCYFLCAMSALAEFPDRVRALFKTQEPNDAGIYEVEFCIGGRQTSVIVDDYIPIT
jgi:calpain-15